MLRQLKNILPLIRPTHRLFDNLSCFSILQQSRRCSSNSGDNDVNVHLWMDTLGVADKEKIRYIRNEVCFPKTRKCKIIQTIKLFKPILYDLLQITLHMLNGETLFAPEDVTVPEYIHLLTLSTNQRKSFYRILRKRKILAKSIGVKELSFKIIPSWNRIDIHITYNNNNIL